MNTIMHAFRGALGHLIGHKSLLLLALMTCLGCTTAVAQDSQEADQKSFSFKKLLMPGPVHEGHAKYEKQCEQCHGDDRPQLCRDCHEEIDADINKQEGFHGLTAKGQPLDCLGCHTEHLGRDGDILNFDADSFNHDGTDYPLTGKHASAPCASCHLPDKKYREAPQECFDCHEKDDNHRGAFGETCNDCHSTEGWRKQNKFDHSETDFQLLGKHEEVQCSACHPDEKYENTPLECVSCHAVNDVHSGNNGRECDKCHKENAWDELSFDHDVDTKFKLKGAHEEINCNACHSKPVYESKTSMLCVDCHINDDKHFGRNGRQCEDCHNEVSWKKQTFDHNIDTKFELLGQHEGLSCESCHLAEDKDKRIDSACVDCHGDDDPHEGQQGKQCDSCHNEKGWQDSVRFDHNLTAFPLLGMHAATGCESCHVTQAYKDAEPSCNSCHAKDDTHKKALGPYCDQCHTPNDWKVWLFDHNKQTDFELDGAHVGLECRSCHNTPAENGVEQSQACIACHAKDDEHNKRFGRTCEQCHVTESFKDIRMQ